MSCIVDNWDCQSYNLVDCPHCGNHKVCKEHLHHFEMLDRFVPLFDEYATEITNAQWTYILLHQNNAIDVNGNVINYNIFGLKLWYDQYSYMLICKNATEIRNEQERLKMKVFKSVINNGLVKISVNGNFEKSLVPLVYSFIE